MSQNKEILSLKWGTIKGWANLREGSIALLEEYFKNGMCVSCALDRPDEERQRVLCVLIDQFDGEIWNDWDGRQMSKEEAKTYITEYGK